MRPPVVSAQVEAVGMECLRLRVKDVDFELNQNIQNVDTDTALAIICRAAHDMPISDIPTPKPTASTIAYCRHCCLPNRGQK